MNQLSPYFFRRSALPEKETIDLHQFMGPEEQGSALMDYWLIIRRNRWLISACALIILFSAALYTFTRTPLYTAQAILLIERRAPQVLKLQDARSEAIDSSDYNNEFYKTQYEILKSRALAERVIRDEGLQSHPLFGGGTANKEEKTGLVSGLWNTIKGRVGFSKTSESKTSESDPTAINPELIGGYLSMLGIKPVVGTGLVQITFTTPDPAVSANLANAHASTYVRYGIDLRSRTNEEAGVFLQQKLLELKERVEKSEAALNSYRRDKGIISLDDKENVVVDRLVDLNKRLTAAEADRIGFEAQVRAIQGRNYAALPAILNSPLIQTLKGELGKSEAEYASLSKEFKPGYPPLENLKARIDESRRRLQGEIQNELKGIEAAYVAAKTKEAELRARLQEQKNNTLSLKDSGVQYAILAREVDTNRQLYDSVLQRMKEIGVAAEVRTSNVYVMGKADPPGGPSYPSKQRSLLLGLLLGLAAGIGLAFLLEQLDNTFKSPEEAERHTRLPNLAVVPDVSRLRSQGNGNGYVSRLMNSAKSEMPSTLFNGSHKQLVLADHPLSLISEAYRTLRSSLLLSQAGGPPHTILVTSATRGEGKTTTLVNTAIVFAQMGVRVLIIDADLRRPRCHALLRVLNGAGLAELLTGQIELQQAIRSTSVDNLFLMASGALPPNPAELLGSRKMDETLQSLREYFEFIFIDSSPVMAVSDVVFLSTMVDGTLLVINGKTPRQLVINARARLTTPHAKILGTLMNRVDGRNGAYGSHYSQYYQYYQEDPAKEA